MNRPASRPSRLAPVAALAVALVAAASGCAAGVVVAEAGAPAAATPAPADDLQKILAGVRADAATAWQLADASRIEASAEAVTWPDGSLGCPQPGRMYTQALVPGWRIVVRDGARERIYHATARGHWLPCPAGRAVPPVAGDATR